MDDMSNENISGIVSIVWTLYMNPQCPQILYLLQKRNKYGIAPHIMLSFFSTPDNISMLCLFSGMITKIVELWTLVSDVTLYQSKWQGWILTFISIKCFTHIWSQDLMATQRYFPFEFFCLFHAINNYTLVLNQLKNGLEWMNDKKILQTLLN